MALRSTKFKASFWLIAGSILLAAGLGTAYAADQFTVLDIVLSIVGALCLLVWARSFQRQKNSAYEKHKSKLIWRYSLSICVLLLLNYAAMRTNVQFDLTRSKQHSLAPSSISLVKELDEDIQIVVFYVGLPPKYLEDLLKGYEIHSSGRVTTEIVDPLVQISYAAQYGTTIKGGEKKCIIKSSTGRRDIEFTDKEPLTQELVNNSIIRVTRKGRNACFVSGHGEYDILDEKETGFSKFAKILLDNHVSSQRLLLETEEKVPDNCDIVIIAGPKKDLTEKEQGKVQDYLEKGGDALFLIENVIVTTPDKPLTDEQMKLNPSLNQILTQWGIKVADDIVVDTASHAGDDVGCPATRNYLKHRAIVGDLDYTFYIRPRSISIATDRRRSVKAAPLVLTTSDEQSWGETDRTLKVRYDEGSDRAGPVPVAFVAWEAKKDKPSAALSDTRLAAFTDADFLSNNYLDAYSNAQMGINVINWLTEVDYRSFVDASAVKVERMDLTSQQKRWVVVILCVMPLIVLLAGLLLLTRKSLSE